MNLGCGDAIAMSPIVADIATKHSETVRIQSYPHNLTSVKSLFVDYPNIEVVMDNVEIPSTYKFGWYSEITPNENEYFVDWFYRQYLKSRLELTDPILKAAQKVEQANRVQVFIHDKPGAKIEMDGFRPAIGGSILRYCDALMNAEEIHVIDSSFVHLVEALPIRGELFFHQYAREGTKNNTYNFKHKWKLLNTALQF